MTTRKASSRNPQARKKFPRSARIPKRKEITSLQQRGKKIYSKNLLLSYRFYGEAPPRIAITVSKKVDKRAVVRNMIQRRVREIFRSVADQLKPGLNLVIIARASAKDQSFLELKKQITKGLQSHRLFQEQKPNE